MSDLKNQQTGDIEVGLSVFRKKSKQVWGSLINPPNSVYEIGARRKAQLSAAISIIMLIVILIIIIASRAYQDISNLVNVIQFSIAAGFVVAYVLSRTKLSIAGSFLLVVIIAASGFSLMFIKPDLSLINFTNGLSSSMTLSLVVGSILLPLPWLITLTVAYFLFITITTTFIPIVSFQGGLVDSGLILAIGGVLILSVIFRNVLERNKLNEVKEINAQLGEAVQELNANSEVLETRVAELNAELDHRNRQIEAAAEVSRVASSILDTTELITKVVELIKKGFGLYYVGLFLVDERFEWATLQAGTGEAGKLLLARGYRIRIGEELVGWCIANAKSRIGSSLQGDSFQPSYSELPFTQSEAALPLLSHGRVIGAMTVQSDKDNAFNQEFILILQAMVDQIAVALDNARLYVESQESIKALRRSYSELSRQSWSSVLQTQSILGYKSDLSGVYSILPDMKSSSIPSEGQIIKIPIKVRDQIVGFIQAQKQETGLIWTSDEVDLLETLVDQLSVALENARLFEEAQIKAEHERVLAEITGHVRSSTDINIILQTAVQDLAEVLKVPNGSIRLIQPSAHSQDSPGKPDASSSKFNSGGTSNEH